MNKKYTSQLDIIIDNSKTLPLMEDDNERLLNNPLQYYNYVHDKFLEVVELNNINIDKITPSQFKFVLSMLYLYIYRINPQLLFTNNEYDANKIYPSIDTYIQLCSRYTMVVSLFGYSCMCGITADTILSWYDRHNNSQSCDGRALWQAHAMLSAYNEQTLEDSMHTQGKNPLAFLSSLNYRHAWENRQYKERLSIQQAITSEDLPILSVTDKQNILDNNT